MFKTGCKKTLIRYSGYFLIITKGNKPMEQADQLFSIFSEIDDFCKESDERIPHPLLTGPLRASGVPKPAYRSVKS